VSAAGLRIAVAGATGVVGEEILAMLAARRFPVATLRPMASARSVGRRVPWAGGEVPVEDLATADFRDVDIAFFSAGSAQADQARRAAAEGALVIDNSSAFREDPAIPLVVPQVNPGDLDALRVRGGRPRAGIVANPNCSTILFVMAVAPIERHVRIVRAVVSTYQAVSGSGAKGLQELERQAGEERRGEPLTSSVYPRPIQANVIPFVQAFVEGGMTTEERKLVRESRRLLGRPDLRLTATCVRVPVRRAHSEAVNLELERTVTPAEARAWLAAAPGVRVIDDPARLEFPTPRDADGGDDVLVGRIRRDPSHERGLDLWLTGDQVRKGAAQNAIEIAEELLRP
jgi:aspartate-semialdehyde dehydrogenase